ncbi:MAG: pyruvate carboxylase subunit B, partial [Deltaproteobacteria bacterium]|nr:pyruvate carboxylase subunit B [Deltaproteobacteria bacterium]
PRLGGDVYNLEYYIQKARDLEAMGADSICIKDMASLLAPYDAYTIVKELKSITSLPIHLHSHFTSGMAPMTLLKAAEAGVDIVDTCMAPYAYRTSHTAVEPLVMTLLGTNRDTGFDIEHLASINEILEREVLPKYKHLLDDTKVSVIDIGVLLHQTPGGMLSNLVNQMREMDALDKIDRVYAELPKVRKDLGQVPLVTPTSQIVGIQAVNNVLFDDETESYKMITSQVKDLCYGLYGKTPVPVNPEVQKKALKDYPRGEEPITCRPAEVLEPELEKAKEDVEGLAVDMDDTLIYALYPVTGKRFLNWKYGKEAPPDEVKPKTLEEVRAEQELIAKAKAGKLMEVIDNDVPDKGPGLRTFNVFVDNEYFEVGVEEAGGASAVSYVKQRSAPVEAPTQIESAAKPATEPEASSSKTVEKVPVQASPLDGTPLVAPMPGMIVKFEKQVGDTVSEGDTVVILEAMKMENAIKAPVAGSIKAIKFSSGDSVAKNDVLCVIG